MKYVHTAWGAASIALLLGGACEPLDIPLFPEGSDLGVEEPPADPAPDAEPPPAVPVGPDAALCAPGAEACCARNGPPKLTSDAAARRQRASRGVATWNR